MAMLTCAMHHRNSNSEGAGNQETAVVNHLFMESLIPVSCGLKRKSVSHLGRV